MNKKSDTTNTDAAAAKIAKRVVKKPVAKKVAEPVVAEKIAAKKVPAKKVTSAKATPAKGTTKAAPKKIAKPRKPAAFFAFTEFKNRKGTVMGVSIFDVITAPSITTARKTAQVANAKAEVTRTTEFDFPTDDAVWASENVEKVALKADSFTVTFKSASTCPAELDDVWYACLAAALKVGEDGTQNDEYLFPSSVPNAKRRDLKNDRMSITVNFAA